MMKTLYIGFLVIIGCVLSFAASVQAAATAQTDIVERLPLHTISLSEIEKQVSSALAEKGAGEIVEAILSGQEKNTVYGSDKPITLEIRSLDFDGQGKRWTANLIFSSGDTVLSAIPAGGRFQLMSRLPVLKKRFSSGEVITLEDVEWKHFPEHYSRKGVITDPQAIAGLAPRSTISEGRPIRDTEISKPIVMKKDALVQMTYAASNLHITVSGQAMDNGGLGDVIKVKNVNSNQVIRAVVQDATTVNVVPLVETSALGGDMNVYN